MSKSPKQPISKKLIKFLAEERIKTALRNKAQQKGGNWAAIYKALERKN